MKILEKLPRNLIGYISSFFEWNEIIVIRKINKNIRRSINQLRWFLLLNKLLLNTSDFIPKFLKHFNQNINKVLKHIKQNT